jgi:hypothetical protein
MSKVGTILEIWIIDISVVQISEVLGEISSVRKGVQVKMVVTITI